MSGALAWLGGASLVGTALVGLVLLARGPARRAFGARAAMWLWAAPGLRLVLPPLGLGLLAWPGGEEAPSPAPPAPPAEALDAAPFVPLPPLTPLTAPVTVPSAADAPSLFALPTPAQALLAVWLFGALLALAHGAFVTARWRRTLLAEAEPAPPALEALLRRAAAEAGYDGAVRLVVSGAAASPQVTGLRAPLVAVPADFARRFATDQQRLALLHEATHLARRDLRWLAAAEALCALHWFNPLLRAGLPRLRADQEAACDEAVRAHGAPVGDYAGTLLRAARGPTVPALTLNHDLARRIETMRDPLPGRARTTIGALLLGGAALLTAASTQADADRGEAEGEAYVFSYSATDDELVLLGEPFAGIAEAVPPAPDVAGVPPIPPVPPGDSFEAQMEAWGDQMGDWGDAFGDAWDGYGEAMGDWGERMGAVGEAIGELAEDCADHKERTDAPTVLTATVEDTGQAVRAVCARGGRGRYASRELARFVANARELSDEEVASYTRRVSEMQAGGARPASRFTFRSSDDDAERAAPPAEARTEPFAAVRATSGTSVTIREGRRHAVALDRQARERTTYAVEDGTLTVRCKTRRNRCPRGDRGEVTVTMPAVASLSASSGGAIAVDGDVPVEGDTLDVRASSGGAVDASAVRARDAAARASSGGSVTLTATRTLDASASSGGSVAHRGGAEVSRRTSSGGSVSGR